MGGGGGCHLTEFVGIFTHQNLQRVTLVSLFQKGQYKTELLLCHVSVFSSGPLL